MNSRYPALTSLFRPGQLPTLDGLRAIAILLVLITHICQRVPGLSYVKWNIEWMNPLYNGWIGVDLFFVLSGFLIGSIIIKDLGENTFMIVRFFLNRFFRIIPAYFCMLGIILFLNNLPVHAFLPEFHGKDFLLNLLFLTNYIPSYMGIPSWSLSIEEQFYFLLPFFLLFITHKENRAYSMLILIAAALLSRMLTYRFYSIGEGYPIEALMKYIYYPFHNRMDALAIGVLIAVLHTNMLIEPLVRSISCGFGLLLTMFVLLSGGLQGGFYYTTIQYSLICFGFGALLFGVIGKNNMSNYCGYILSKKAWVPVARISYSVYLSHLLIINILIQYFAFKAWMVPGVTIFCLLMALPLYLLIEYPCHQFARRRFQSNIRIEAAHLST